MQAFLEYSSLQDLFGVEISKPRYDIAEAAFLRLAAYFPEEFTLLSYHEGRSITVGTPVDSSTQRSHVRLDAAGLLQALTGENVHATDANWLHGNNGSDGGHSADLRHPGDSAAHSPQLDGRRGSEDDDASPSPSREPTSIHIPPHATSVSAGSTGGSSMSRASGQRSTTASSQRPTAPSALDKSLPRAHQAEHRQPATCFPNSHCAVEYRPSEWRTARIAWGDMFDTCHVDTADLICIETDVPGACYPLLAALIRSAKKGARILSYLNLAEMWPREMRRFFNLEQLTINRSVYDRFWTSWSYVNGHKFYLWQCMRSPLPLQVDVKRQRDGTTHVLVTVPPSVSSLRGGPLIRRIGTGFEASVADGASWKQLLEPPVWTWEDVCEVHGAGRRPRLLVFGGLLNNYGGVIEAHEDEPVTFSCLVPEAHALQPSGSSCPDVPQTDTSSTLRSEGSGAEVPSAEAGPISRASSSTLPPPHDASQSSRSGSAASADCGNPVLAYAVSSVRDLDHASYALPPSSRPSSSSASAAVGPAKPVRLDQSDTWLGEFVLPGTPEGGTQRSSSGFTSRPQRTVHVER